MSALERQRARLELLNPRESLDLGGGWVGGGGVGVRAVAFRLNSIDILLSHLLGITRLRQIPQNKVVSALVICKQFVAKCHPVVPLLGIIHLRYIPKKSCECRSHQG